MDAQHEDISVALYVRETDGGAAGTVFSYSAKPGTAGRLVEIADAMCSIGGMVREGDGPVVRFACGQWHAAAARRLFIEAVKLKPDEPRGARELSLPDSRTDQTIKIAPAGNGVYEVTADNLADGERSRAGAIGKAMAKLAELDYDEDRSVVTFTCGSEHDALIGLLLVRAQNLRQVLREEEMQASRGVLSAPGSDEDS